MEAVDAAGNDLYRAIDNTMGRAAFGDALKVWSDAADASDDAVVLRAFRALLDAYWAWVDAYHLIKVLFTEYQENKFHVLVN